MPFVLSVLARDRTFSPEVLRRVRTVHNFLQRGEDEEVANKRQYHCMVNLLYSRSQPFVFMAGAPHQRFWLLKETAGEDTLDHFMYEMPCTLKDAAQVEQTSGDRDRAMSKYQSVYDGEPVDSELNLNSNLAVLTERCRDRNSSL